MTTKMIDLDKIKRIYKLGQNLSPGDVEALIHSAKRKSLAPKENLIEVGDINKEIYFIQKGLIRCFKVNDKGEEITTLLQWENQFFASPDVLLFDQPSQFTYEALEMTELYCMDYEKLQAILAGNPKLAENRKYIIQSILRRAFLRIDSFVLMSPEDRYLEFIKTNPDIVNRVPNKYIANVLGITPVSLSRIRRRIASKKDLDL